MAKKESERIISWRRDNVDRISVLVPKGGKQLLRILAQREGIKITEMIRKAILTRAGLNMMPYPEDFKGLEKIPENDMDAARTAVKVLQDMERTPIRQKTIQEYGIELPSAEYRLFIDKLDEKIIMDVIHKIVSALRETPKSITGKLGGTPVHISGKELVALRRMLSDVTNTDDIING